MREVKQDKNIGKLVCGNIDVSLQMLRDGAAWYYTPEIDSHNRIERVEYQEAENAAKAERRGIWGVPGLKPSWEVKAESEAKQKKAEKVAKELAYQKQLEERDKRRAKERDQANANVQMWPDIPLYPSENSISRIGSATSRRSARGTLTSVAKESFDADVQNQLLTQVKLASNISYAYSSAKKGENRVNNFANLRDSIQTLENLFERIYPPFRTRENISVLSRIATILLDIRTTFVIMGRESHSFYRDDLVRLAGLYRAKPTTGLNGEKIISKQDIMGNMFTMLVSNFDQLRSNLASN